MPYEGLTDAYMDATMAEFRTGWQGWQDRARSVFRMSQPSAPKTFTSSSALAGSVATKVEAAVAEAARYSSARCAAIARNFVGRGIAVPAKIEPLVIAAGRQDQAAQRKLFMMLGGIHNVLDDHVQNTAQGSSWDEMVLKSIFHFGKAAVFPHARYRYGDGDQVEFSAEVVDPLLVMHDFDSWPRRVVKEVSIGGQDAEYELQMYQGKAGEGYGRAMAALKGRDGRYQHSVTLTDFWCAYRLEPGEKSTKEYHVWHAVRVNNITAACWETEFDHLPWVLQSVHSSPSTYQDTQTGGSSAGNGSGSTRGVAADRILYHAEGFLAPLLAVEDQFLQAMSDIMEGAGRVLNPGEDVTLMEGAKESDIPPESHSGPGSRRVHPDTVKMGVQETPDGQIGEALRIFFENSAKEYERLFPDVQFGQSNPGDAGYLQVIKTNAASAVTQETIKGWASIGERTFEEFISQWKRQDLKFHVEGWRQEGKAGPQDFEGGDFTSKDFPPRYSLNYQVNFDLPPNEAAKAEVAAAMQAGRWMSNREIMVNIFDNPDPDRTLELLDQQEYEAMEPVRMRRMLYQMRQEIRALEDAADEATDTAERNGLLLELEYAKADYAMASGQPPANTGTPPGPPGMSPSTLPPEMGVGTNADRKSEAQGRVSSYTGGKPRQKAG